MRKNYKINADRPLTTAFPYFPPQHRALLQAELDEILRGKLSLGPRTQKFEEGFASLCGASEGIAFPSCTSALEASLQSLGLKPGDEVLVPSQTFIATGMAVHLAGGRPVFTEVSKTCFSMDFEDAWSRVTKKTAGAIVVHFGGFIDPLFPEFVKKMKSSGRFVIEDAAHAHGSQLDGQFAGSFGDAGCFSFYPTKIMTTGEGGMITTSRHDVAAVARSIQQRGIDTACLEEKYVRPARNNRFTEIAAAMGLSQLQCLPTFLANRRAVAKTYDRLLHDHPLLGAVVPREGNHPSYWRYFIFLNKIIPRERLKAAIRDEGITIDWAYSPALHLQPVFRELYGTKPGMLPIAEDLMERHISLPMHAQLIPEDAEYVVDRLNRHLAAFF